MSYYLKDGSTLWPTDEGAFDIRDHLPAGTYMVGHSLKGWFLEPMDEFKITGKVYGKISRQADRILATFADRPKATGVLMSGEKGSGKTMLAKMISEKAASQGIPTLVINTAFTGDAFNMFIQSIDEPCILVFDEFEKVYDEKEQEALLTLLDGVYPSKKLFILTANDRYRINQHMKNRPGRIFYYLEFGGLDAAFIEEYCLDNLQNKTHIQQVCNLTLLFDSFNFDMLKALVEEMNRYNESPKQAMEMLNAKPYDAGMTYHNVEVTIDGEKIESNRVNPSRIRGNPIAQEELTFWIAPVPRTEDDPDEDEDGSCELEITPQHLKRIDVEAGAFTYLIEDGPKTAVFVITRESYTKKPLNWLDAF
jgi:ATPase family associated with various cellular activities (AAA)